MPIYDYVCTRCNHRGEKFSGYSDPNPTCPACGASTARLPSAPALHGSMAQGREAAMRSLATGTAKCPACTAGHPHRHTT